MSWWHLRDSDTGQNLGYATPTQVIASLSAAPTGHILIDASTGTVLGLNPDHTDWPLTRRVHVV